MSAADHLGQQWWHGSPSGDLRGGSSGLHLGTREAAVQALNARIGKPLEGEWDGSREYGKTMLAPYYVGPHRATEPGFAETMPQYSDGSRMLPTDRPRIDAFEISGPMTNTPRTPHEDFHANGYMSGQLKRGRAKSGYFYENVSEDEGSISAVVPNGSHLRRPAAITNAATVLLGGTVRK